MNKQSGITLIELMVVMVIVAIITAIAVPSYSNYMKKTRRNMAASCLQENAQFMERWYTSKMTYEGAVASACPAELDDYYDVDIEVTGPREFTAQAVPKGAQAGDKCGTLSIDEKGLRRSSTLDEASCF